MAIINQGKLLYAGSPASAIEELNGIVWEKLIDKSEMTYYERQYSIISSRLVTGHPLIHIISTTDPGQGFRKVEADLEDVFFTKVMGIESLVPVLD